MRAAGIAGVSRRRWTTTTVRDRDARLAPDLVQRAFVAEGPNRLWAADITYVSTWAGFPYLAVVIDLWSRNRAFGTKWSKLAPAVARSLEEAGEQLLTFYEFPKAMWRALRTTNSLENLNREFRRRTKTQAPFSSEEAPVTLLWALVAFEQIQLRKMDGHRAVASLLPHAVEAAA